MNKLRFSGKREAEDIDLPAYRLHPLKGEYEGYYSVAVNGNWRIVFCFEGETPKDVDLVGYN